MSVVINIIRRGFYMDSVALMRLTRQLGAFPGVEQAGLMMGTPSNKAILDEARLLGAEGEAAGAGDLLIAIRARDEASARAAEKNAAQLIEVPRSAATAASHSQPRSLGAAARSMPAATLALISVPGAFAAGEAFKALAADLDVMIFSDNVPIEEEVRLKQDAARRGRLLMGPDCGTAIINGVPLGFANSVRRGDIAIIGASGTGIQEISTLVDKLGGGISHAIGTGGRDLSAGVGGMTMLQAIDLLERDSGTRRIVIVSKPPAAQVSQRVIDRVARSTKPFIICFLGAPALSLPGNAKQANTLEEAAEIASGRRVAGLAAMAPDDTRLPKVRRVKGLYCGGTLCAEAQAIFSRADIEVSSNVPIPGAKRAGGASAVELIDLGEDEYTLGRPHPMIEPSLRDALLREAMADKSIDAVLLDVVLGFGSHPSPGAHLANVVAAAADRRPLLVASITGTPSDPQNLDTESSALSAAGVRVCQSAAQAARLVVGAMKG